MWRAHQGDRRFVRLAGLYVCIAIGTAGCDAERIADHANVVEPEVARILASTHFRQASLSANDVARRRAGAGEMRQWSLRPGTQPDGSPAALVASHFDAWPGAMDPTLSLDTPPDYDDGEGTCTLGSYACGWSYANVDGFESVGWAEGGTSTTGGRKAFLLLLGWAYWREGVSLPVAAALYCAQAPGTGCMDFAAWDSSCNYQWNEIRSVNFHYAAFLNAIRRGNTSDSDTCSPTGPGGGSGGPTCGYQIVNVEIWQDSSGTWQLEQSSEYVCE